MKCEPTVFVVDADESTREAVCNLASTMNLPCQVFASGHEFLDAYDPSQPGCLVLEVKIPGVNGFQIQERLADQGAVLPLVFLTAQATVSIAVRAMRAGAVHFLEKPFRDHELWDTIQEAIQVDKEQRSAWIQQQELKERTAQLTSDEQMVFEMIAEGRSKKYMANKMGVCVRTVEIRQTQLMRKLRAKSALDLLRFALVANDGHSLLVQSST